MQHNIANAPEETIADFTVAHLAILKECQDKAIAIVRKDNPKMSELNAALNILIKIEKQQYNITHRRPPTSKSSKTRHEPTPIIAFTPPPARETPKTEPQSNPNSNETTPIILNETTLQACHMNRQGFHSATCTVCAKGPCPHFPAVGY